MMVASGPCGAQACHSNARSTGGIVSGPDGDLLARQAEFEELR